MEGAQKKSWKTLALPLVALAGGFILSFVALGAFCCFRRLRGIMPQRHGLWLPAAARAGHSAFPQRHVGIPSHRRRTGRHRRLHVSTIEQRIADLGLTLPAPLQLPPGVVLPFPWVRTVGTRAIISGHGPTGVDGSLAPPLGKVGRDVSLEQAYAAARLTGLAILGSLKRELGELDRIAAWTRVFGMVSSAPGFNRQPAVINGFTDLIVEIFGPAKGAHARSAVGMAELPFDIPVEIEGEVQLFA